METAIGDMLQGGGTFSRCIAQIALTHFSDIARLSNENEGIWVGVFAFGTEQNHPPPKGVVVMREEGGVG